MIESVYAKIFDASSESCFQDQVFSSVCIKPARKGVTACLSSTSSEQSGNWLDHVI